MFHSLKIFYHTDEQTKLDWPHSKQKMCASEQEVMPGIEKGIMGWQKHQLARNTKNPSTFMYQRPGAPMHTEKSDRLQRRSKQIQNYNCGF